MFASNKKTTVLLLVAIGLGVLGALFAMLYLNAREASLRELLKPKSVPISVVVASRDLVKGDLLNTSNLSIREIPSEFVSNEAIRPEQFAAIEGQVLQENLANGKALLRSYIGLEYPLDFSDTIIEKRRAMTIQVDENSTFTGLLRPGNRIDILVNKSSESAAGGKHVVPVLENVEVLSTGEQTAKDYEEKVRILRGGTVIKPETSYTTISVNVTPKEGAILKLALTQGDLLALLRNRKDASGLGLTSVDQTTVEQYAKELAKKEQIRRASQQLGNNIVVGEDGVLRTKDGKVLANQNLVVGKDGRIRTKSGIDLTGRGLTINEKGELVDKDGNVVDPDNLVIAADGSLMTKDGRVLDGKKVQTLAGAVQLADGSVQLSDGRIITGAKLDKDGNLVLADGTVVNPDDVIVGSDGQLIRKDGTVIAGVTVDRPVGKLKVAADGSLVMADGTKLQGARLNKDGKLVLADGTVVDPKDVIIRADGTVVTKDGQVLAGVTATFNTQNEAVALELLTVDYIVGGVSKDSVATVNKVKVEQ